MTLRALFAASLLLALTACGEKDGDAGDDTSPTDDSAASDDSGATDDSSGSEAEDYGPANSWPHATTDEVPEGLTGEGFRMGQTALNFTLVDQNGDEVELYQFYGHVVVLDILAEWCGPCQAAAPEGEAAWLGGEGDLIYIALVQETAAGGPPGAEDAARWAETYELTHPVIADPGGTHNQWLNGGYPTYIVLDREMKVINEDMYPFRAEEAIALLE